MLRGRAIELRFEDAAKNWTNIHGSSMSVHYGSKGKLKVRAKYIGRLRTLL